MDTLNDKYDKMLPCPFCGSQAKIEETWIPPSMEENYVPTFYVGCPDTKCRGFIPCGFFKAGIPKEIERWNRRVL
jgi:hypothetical protein